ncbi:MAG: hypothetical protein RIS64_4563 [Bacteroidota bacterium]
MTTLPLSSYHTPAAAPRIALRSVRPTTTTSLVNRNAALYNMFKKIALPTMEGMSFENQHDILYFEAQGNYTTIHFADGRQILVCKTLNYLEEMLGDDTQFVRVHRSSTINLNRISRYVKGKGGYVVMENGEHINVSEGKKQDFLDAIRDYFGAKEA